MDEFIKLFLTGKRAENMARFRAVMNLFGAVGMVLALVPVILTFVKEEPSLPLIAAFSAIGVLFGAAGVIFRQYQTAYVRGLAQLQNAANEIELRGDERERCARLYAAFTKTLGKRNSFGTLSAALSLFGYLALTAVAVLSAIYSVPQAVMLAACAVYGLAMVVTTVLQVTTDGRARTAFYECAEREIEEIKRDRFGMSEIRIASESENARAYSAVPLSVVMFLKEDAERAEFQWVAKRSGVAAFLIGLAIGAALFLACFGDLWKKLGPALSWTLAGAFFALLFAVFFTLLFPLERRKKEIYRRNFEKLSDGETDALRKQLQAAWIRLQKSGNVMFSIALMAPILVGTVLGVIGYFTVEGMVLAESIGGCIMCLLIPAAILSVVVWIVMFAVYRRRVRPTEICLKEKCREGRENERDG